MTQDTAEVDDLHADILESHGQNLTEVAEIVTGSSSVQHALMCWQLVAAMLVVVCLLEAALLCLVLKGRIWRCSALGTAGVSHLEAGN